MRNGRNRREILQSLEKAREEEEEEEEEVVVVVEEEFT